MWTAIFHFSAPGPDKTKIGQKVVFFFLRLPLSGISKIYLKMIALLEALLGNSEELDLHKTPWPLLEVYWQK